MATWPEVIPTAVNLSVGSMVTEVAGEGNAALKRTAPEPMCQPLMKPSRETVTRRKERTARSTMGREWPSKLRSGWIEDDLDEVGNIVFDFMRSKIDQM